MSIKVTALHIVNGTEIPLEPIIEKIALAIITTGKLPEDMDELFWLELEDHPDGGKRATITFTELGQSQWEAFCAAGYSIEAGTHTVH